MDVEDFIARWSSAPISERAQYQTFITQLCRLLDVPAPDDERIGDLDYAFERPVRFQHDDGTAHPGFIDCYRRDCFVLEAKQSTKTAVGVVPDPLAELERVGLRGRRMATTLTGAQDRLMRIAKRQAEGYAKALDEWPPFLVVVDVGQAIELWSDFARQGKTYTPFPDRARHRIRLQDLRDPEVRARLARVWTGPMDLDPSARIAEVTTDIAALLGRVIKSIETRAPRDPSGQIDPVVQQAWIERTAWFVMQCIFAMFADSVGLIGRRAFLGLLQSYRGQAECFHEGAADFFRHMDQGGHCAAVRQDIRRFNGGLFRQAVTVPITEAELEGLIAAARHDWASVDPAIFGTLLEQALDPRERARLGAHYTPRNYVERLVEPALIEPLRADWEAIEAQAIGHYLAGDVRGAQKRVREFHRYLCHVRVLDPACGTGNFLYVAMRMMKELEGEVLSVLAELGDTQDALMMDGHSVSPRQFLGLELNGRAVAIAELVMWIGHLQWHFSVFGTAMPSEPILRNFETIRKADALISCDRLEYVRGTDGPVARYVNPRPTPWPDAHFIIGNPPFIAGKDLRRELGDAYVDALWHIRQGRHRSADLVTCWWDRAAELLKTRGARLRRFGFITTNSITQTFSRRVLEDHLGPDGGVRLVMAVPDHPWVKGEGAAIVRIAMTVAEAGQANGSGRLLTLREGADDAALRQTQGDIGADLRVGGSVMSAVPLRANAAICSPGVKLHGSGFLVTPEDADRLASASEVDEPRPDRPYVNGRDMASQSRNLRVIDFFDRDELTIRRQHPGFYQHLLETVRPTRERNARKSYRDSWWVFGEPRRDLRRALQGLDRYIVTIETAKHRWFRFLDAETLPDNKLIVVASPDPFHLGVLSSSVHAAWYRASAGRIGGVEGEAVYVKSGCFDPFPFPQASTLMRARIASLAEELEDLRVRVLAAHPTLTMTMLYNARLALMSGAPLTPQQKRVHDLGCVGLMDHLHGEIDRAVSQAYGWDEAITDVDVVARLLALNRERARAEVIGQVAWLRPDFQPGLVGVSVPATRHGPTLFGREEIATLPDEPAEMAKIVLGVLRQVGAPVQPGTLARGFRTVRGKRTEHRIEQVLAVLSVAGSVQRTPEGWFAPRRVD